MLCPNVKMRVKRPPREIAFEPPPDKIESVRFAAVTLVRHTAQRTLYPRSCNPGVNTPFAFRKTISGRETDPPLPILTFTHCIVDALRGTMDS